MANKRLSKNELTALIIEHEQRGFAAANAVASTVGSMLVGSAVLILIVGLFAVHLKLIGIGVSMLIVGGMFLNSFSTKVEASRNNLLKALAEESSSKPSQPKENAVEATTPEKPARVIEPDVVKPKVEAPRQPAKAAKRRQPTQMATPVKHSAKQSAKPKRKPMATPVAKRSSRRPLGVIPGLGNSQVSENARREPTISEPAIPEQVVSQEVYDAYMNG